MAAAAAVAAAVATAAVEVAVPIPAVSVAAAAAAPAVMAAPRVRVPGPGVVCVFQLLPRLLPILDEDAGSVGRRGPTLVTTRSLPSGRTYARERSGLAVQSQPGVAKSFRQCVVAIDDLATVEGSGGIEQAMKAVVQECVGSFCPSMVVVNPVCRLWKLSYLSLV